MDTVDTTAMPTHSHIRINSTYSYNELYVMYDITLFSTNYGCVVLQIAFITLLIDSDMSETDH